MPAVFGAGLRPQIETIQSRSTVAFLPSLPAPIPGGLPCLTPSLTSRLHGSAPSRTAVAARRSSIPGAPRTARTGVPVGW
ncbi:protein of unknown function [Cyanobium sp. NIES-981]|nr:protein of unknown function [Cyanobium sp. NIES-981]